MSWQLASLAQAQEKRVLKMMIDEVLDDLTYCESFKDTLFELKKLRIAHKGAARHFFNDDDKDSLIIGVQYFDNSWIPYDTWKSTDIKNDAYLIIGFKRKMECSSDVHEIIEKWVDKNDYREKVFELMGEGAE